ncbi:hypothetical protein ACHAW6_003614 [Cyclotella cf. meneghiniana]
MTSLRPLPENSPEVPAAAASRRLSSAACSSTTAMPPPSYVKNCLLGEVACQLFTSLGYLQGNTKGMPGRPGQATWGPPSQNWGKLGRDGKAACVSTQLCASLEAEIEGAIHAAALRAKDDTSFQFNDWEIEDSTWLAEAEDGALPPWEDDPMADGPLTQETPNDPTDPTCATGGLEGPGLHTTCTGTNAG